MTPSFDAVISAFAVTCFAALATLLGALALWRAHPTRTHTLAFGLAFAGGAMVYVSLVEIFQKAVLAFTTTHGDKTGYALATLFFFMGVGAVALLDRLVPNPHVDIAHVSARPAAHVGKVGLMATLAITVHNFPEGMATFFATLDNPLIGAPLAAAIAVHNIPEGISIAIPVYYATNSKTKAVGAVAVSALAEPVGAALGYAVLAPFLSHAVFGGVFGMIAGAMVYLALDELLPAARQHARGHETVFGMITGMGVIALSLVLFR